MGLEKEDIKQLIAILQKGLVEDEEKGLEVSKTKTKKGVIKNKSRNSSEEHENKFLQMAEKNMHKSDSLIDKKLKKFPPTPRNRPASMVNVVCRVCGKKDFVSSQILPESAARYKCNNCATTGG
jgi:hypothetical protein